LQTLPDLGDVLRFPNDPRARDGIENAQNELLTDTNVTN
jgi:hypothetical protein